MSGPVYGEVLPKTFKCEQCGMPVGYPWIGPNGLRFCSIKCLEEYRSEIESRPIGLEPMPDPVISPPHYTSGGIETIDFIKAKLTPDEWRGFLKGSIIKYLSRANLKGNEEQDYAKASFYSRMLAGDDPRKEAE